jgi:hypothetical protein
LEGVMAGSPEIDFCAVSIKNRVAITDSGCECPITNMFDEDGDETTEDDEAVVIVVKVSVECWVVVNMDEFEDASLN